MTPNCSGEQREPGATQPLPKEGERKERTPLGWWRAAPASPAILIPVRGQPLHWPVPPRDRGAGRGGCGDQHWACTEAAAGKS